MACLKCESVAPSGNQVGFKLLTSSSGLNAVLIIQ